MDLAEGHVAEGEAQAPVEALADAADDRLGRDAVRALKVAVHDELQRRVLGAQDVVVGAERWGEARRGHALQPTARGAGPEPSAAA